MRKMRRATLLVILAALVGFASPAAADSALNMTGATQVLTSSYPELSSGWACTPKVQLLVTRLGYYAASTTLNASHVITIYDGGGNVVVKGTVGSGTVTPDVDGYAYVDVSAQNAELEADQTYVIASYWTQTGYADLDIQFADGYTVATDYISLESLDFQASGHGMPIDLPGTYNRFLSANFQFELVPDDPVVMIEDLVVTVEGYNLQQGIDNSLDAKLDAALGALEDANQNNDASAVNKLQAFINEVEAQRDNKITNEQADELHDAAQAIIDLLNGS